jgi:hypothetical protein
LKSLLQIGNKTVSNTTRTNTSRSHITVWKKLEF